MKTQFNPDRTRLTITASEGERANLRSLGETIHSDTMLADVFEHITANSNLEWIRPEETGDLTDAPMLGVCDYHKTRLCQERAVLMRWAFMDYQVRSVLEDLRDKGEVVFVGGSVK